MTYRTIAQEVSSMAHFVNGQHAQNNSYFLDKRVFISESMWSVLPGQRMEYFSDKVWNGEHPNRWLGLIQLGLGKKSHLEYDGVLKSWALQVFNKLPLNQIGLIQLGFLRIKISSKVSQYFENLSPSVFQQATTQPNQKWNSRFPGKLLNALHKIVVHEQPYQDGC